MPNAIIETLKGDTENGEKYYIYPVTLESAVVDNNGTSLATKLENISNLTNTITTVFVPASSWSSSGEIYTTTITGLTLDTESNYEIAFNHTDLADDVYLSLASCFIVPSSYTESTLTLKALSAQPAYDFYVLIIRR